MSQGRSQQSSQAATQPQGRDDVCETCQGRSFTVFDGLRVCDLCHVAQAGWVDVEADSEDVAAVRNFSRITTLKSNRQRVNVDDERPRISCAELYQDLIGIQSARVAAAFELDADVLRSHCQRLWFRWLDRGGLWRVLGDEANVRLALESVECTLCIVLAACRLCVGGPLVAEVAHMVLAHEVPLFSPLQWMARELGWSAKRVPVLDNRRLLQLAPRLRSQGKATIDEAQWRALTTSGPMSILTLQQRLLVGMYSVAEVCEFTLPLPAMSTLLRVADRMVLTLVGTASELHDAMRVVCRAALGWRSNQVQRDGYAALPWPEHGFSAALAVVAFKCVEPSTKMLDDMAEWLRAESFAVNHVVHTHMPTTVRAIADAVGAAMSIARSDTAFQRDAGGAGGDVGVGDAAGLALRHAYLMSDCGDRHTDEQVLLAAQVAARLSGCRLDLVFKGLRRIEKLLGMRSAQWCRLADALLTAHASGSAQVSADLSGVDAVSLRRFEVDLTFDGSSVLRFERFADKGNALFAQVSESKRRPAPRRLCEDDDAQLDDAGPDKRARSQEDSVVAHSSSSSPSSRSARRRHVSRVEHADDDEALFVVEASEGAAAPARSLSSSEMVVFVSDEDY